MDRETFEKELVKYKIVRLEDSYRPRSKKPELKVQHPKITHEAVKTTPKPVTPKEEVTQELSFWELMEKHASEVLTPEETQKFLAALRKNYEDINEYVNLEDFNSAAATLTA